MKFRKSREFDGYELACDKCGRVVFTFSNHFVENMDDGNRDYILMLASFHETSCGVGLPYRDRGVRVIKVKRRSVR